MSEREKPGDPKPYYEAHVFCCTNRRPLRGVIPLACLLLFIQGISEVMKSVWAARTGQFLVHQEKLEL